MEIACKVTSSIPGTCINLLLLGRYEKLIQETYTEPQNEEILGSYLYPQPEKGYQEQGEKRYMTKKVKVAKKKEERTKDIRKFFAPVSTSIATSSSNIATSSNNDNAVMEID